MVTKVSEVQHIVRRGVLNPKEVFPAIRKMAESDDWKVREVAATALVEISKKKPNEVVQEMIAWAGAADPNVRRTASEGLRDVARKDPDNVVPVVEKLKADTNLYVKKSVANVLRNVSRRNPEFVKDLCTKWATLGDANTNWIIKDGLRKLKESHAKDVAAILARVQRK